MPLTPLDIHNKEFRRTFRGYSEEDVDEFLDEVVRDFEALLRENAQLKGQIEELNARLTHYRSMEETMNNTLVLAQQTADELRENSRGEAELVVREAEGRAADLVRRGEDQLRRLQQRAQRARDELQQLRARLRGMFAAHMELVDQQAEELDGMAVGGDRSGVDDGAAPAAMDEVLDGTSAAERPAAAIVSEPPAGPLPAGMEAEGEMEAGTEAAAGVANAAAATGEGPDREEDEPLYG